MSSSSLLTTKNFLCSYIRAAGRHAAQFPVLKCFERCFQGERLPPVNRHRRYERSDLFARHEQVINFCHVLIFQSLDAREERTQFVLGQSRDRRDRRLGYTKTSHAIGELVPPSWTERCH